MKNFIINVLTALLTILSVFVVHAENTQFTSAHFSGSGNCSQCHDGLTDVSGNDVSIVRDWGASMMANSAKDPFWQAKVASELKRNSHLSSVINDKCTQCHAPMANYEINQSSAEVTLFGSNGILNQGHEYYDAAMNGVSCTVCHQIEDDASLGTLNGFSGNYNFNDSKTLYGQYSGVSTQPMFNNTGYTPAYSAHVSDSAMCATCHNLKTPFVDAQGNILTTTADTEFPEQMPYTEWQHSIFDDAGSNPQSCQDCHMPTTTSIVSTRPQGLSARSGFAKHELVGGNTVMLNLLKDNTAQLGVTSNDLDTAISRSRDMLQSSVTVDIVSASVNDGLLETKVALENHSGHKTPSGYPSRRMWLHFVVTDEDDNIVFESGRVNADGSISAADNDEDQSRFEPHYDLITSQDQVQIYEPVMGDSDSNITYTLLRGAQYLKDNRLTPKGFNKLAVPDDVAVKGQALNDDDFNLGVDEITYRVPVSVTEDLKISVSINYQVIAYGFLQDLYRDDELEQVESFKSMYDAQQLKHELIAQDSLVVQLNESDSDDVADGVSDDASDDVNESVEVVENNASVNNSSGGSVSLTALLWLSGLWPFLIWVRAKQQ